MSVLFWTERDFKRILDAIPDALVIVRDHEVLLKNPAFEALEVSELRLEVGVQTLKKPDGTSAIVQITAAEVENFKGRPATLYTVRNVTAERALDARLRFTDRMVAVGTLATGAAHEINNPLAYLLANLTYLEECLREIASENPRVAESLVAVGDARDGARRIEKIVRDLRTFSAKTDSGVARGDPARAVQAAVSLLARSIESRARIAVEIAPVPEVAMGESRMAHVLSGLLSNAKDAFAAHDPKNEIKVAVFLAGERHVRIEVRDNGRGMSRDVVERIFDPFFTTKDIGSGAGLGLYVAHNLVTGAGGTLSAESQPGDGSRFMITLPLSRTASGEFLAPVRSGRPNVLIGEPNKHVANAMRRLLGDYEVTIASTGNEAVELCKIENFDLVLLEVGMPDLTAPEMQKRILELEHKPELLFMTQGGSGTTDLMLISLLGEAPLEKPFDVRKIVASVLDQKT